MVVGVARECAASGSRFEQSLCEGDAGGDVVAVHLLHGYGVVGEYVFFVCVCCLRYAAFAWLYGLLCGGAACKCNQGEGYNCYMQMDFHFFSGMFCIIQFTNLMYVLIFCKPLRIFEV